MPFTFSHIGFILPIQKRWKEKISITGLVFGSLAPDYDILFRLTNIRTHIFQYDFKTILCLIFPLALLSALLFHLFCRNIIIEHLPVSYQQKYQQYLSFDFFQYFKKQYIRTSLSIIFAIYLHLFLDFFCHCLDAYSIKIFVLQIIQNDAIGNIAYVSGIYTLPVLFSLIGFYLIYIYEFHRKLSIKKLELTKSKALFWGWLLLLTGLLTIIKFYALQKEKEFLIDYIIVSITSSFLIAVYAISLLYFFIQKTKRAQWTS